MDPEPDDDGVRDEASGDHPEAAAEDGNHGKPDPDVEVGKVGEVVEPRVVGE